MTPQDHAFAHRPPDLTAISCPKKSTAILRLCVVLMSLLAGLFVLIALKKRLHAKKYLWDRAHRLSIAGIGLLLPRWDGRKQLLFL